MILYLVLSVYVMLALTMTAWWTIGWTDVVTRRIPDLRHYRPPAVSALWTYYVLLSGNWDSPWWLVVTVVIAAVCCGFVMLSVLAEFACTRAVAHIRRR